LQAAVESWFSQGNGDALLFDETILPAADERYDTFDFLEPRRLTARFPPAQYRMVDCIGFQDYAFNFAGSHQYYRRSPGVHADIAPVMTGISQAISSRASRRRRGPSPARGRGP
jgi:hypothetical protein